MRVLATILFILASSPAWALGLCENLQTTYALETVSETAGEYVLRGTMDWCEEGAESQHFEEGEEGKYRFGQVLGFDGKIRRWFLAETEARLQKRFKADTKAAKVETMAALAAYEKAGNFKRVAALSDSPSGRCSAAEHVGEVKDKNATFEVASISLKISAAGKVLLRHTLGNAALQEDRVTKAVFLPKRQEVLVWASLPHCEEGFSEGPGDAPNCALEQRLKVAVLSSKEYPALASCFAPAPKASEEGAKGAKKGADVDKAKGGSKKP